MHQFWPSQEIQLTTQILIFTIDAIIPFFILPYLYVRIVWMLVKKLRSRKDIDANKSTAGNAKLQTAKFNVLKTLLIVVSCVFICFINLIVVQLMYVAGYPVDWNGLHYKVAVGMSFLTCTINPFIYLFNYTDFQKALKDLFCSSRLFSRDDKAPVSTVSSTL